MAISEESPGCSEYRGAGEAALPGMFPAVLQPVKTLAL